MRQISIILFFIAFQILYSQSGYEIISSSEDELVIKIITEPLSEDDLRPFNLLIGLPTPNLPTIEIERSAEKSHSFQVNKTSPGAVWIHNQKVNDLFTGTLQVSPVANPKTYFTDILLRIAFESTISQEKGIDEIHQSLLAPKVVNWNIAKKWIKPTIKNRIEKSNLPDGMWINFKIKNDNVYRIDGKLINSTIGTTSNLDPRSIMIFTGSAYGRDKTYDLSQRLVSESKVPSNMVEIPITIYGESDGNLSDSDFLFFYAKGPSGYDVNLNKVEWHQNLYFNESLYWLLIPHDSSLRGKRVKTGNIVNDGPLEANFGLTYYHYEIDNINPQESGLAWGDQSIKPSASIVQSVDLSHPLLSAKAAGGFGMIGNETSGTRYKNTDHNISLQINNINLSKLNWSNIGLKSGSFDIEAGLLRHGLNGFKLTNESENPNSEPFFDFLDIAYQRKLIYESPFEFFSSIQSTDITYKIDGKNIIAWNISNAINPENRPIITLDNSYFRVSIPQDTLQRFYIFSTEDIIKVDDLIMIGEKKWNVLRSVNNNAKHIIIGPESFRMASNSLINHRPNTFYSSLENIYDEFSGGNKDPIAIRYFLNWAQNNWNSSPSTVLFMGDADYDYRNISGFSKMVIPTIQIGTLNTHATDDRLVAFNGTIPEMASGRFPARTEDEVKNFSNKIIEFENKINSESWRQKITLVADDPSRPEKESFELAIGKSHTFNSEKLSKLIPDFMEIKKLYLVDYKEVNDGTPLGVTKPSATQELIDIINSGTSIINYIGHGNSTQWAQEKLLILNEQRNDIELMNTKMRLPLWIAGTCNWGHFDNINEESFAEELIRTPLDAASAVISTSRGISVTSNIQFLNRLFSEIFKNNNITSKTIGSVLQSVKTGGSDGELFHLFGDPAMMIPLPSNIISDAYVDPDTISTLEIGTLNISSDLRNGSGSLVLQDAQKEVSVNFFYGSKQETISFQRSGANLFKGAFTFSDEIIQPKFRVPKDISYSKDFANIRFHIIGANGQEAIGAVSNILLTPGGASSDVEGPIITFETKSGRLLRSGDHINRDSELNIRISDPSGINITGEKGHELILYDELLDKELLLNDKFIYDINSLTMGSSSYSPEPDFDEISFSVQAWDNANNPSEVQINLTIIELDKFELKNVLNYPNPFYENTQFTFELTQDGEVKIDIYTLGGLKVKSFPSSFFSQGFGIIDWDGRDDFGQLLSNGVYLYQVKAQSNIAKINYIGRLAIIR
ncbi:MAG: C25 family cysteine peptidase [Candidatus Neomarinimicrobiota bacterium]|nr:C25 family cysteine peptidase [Candidatus Neomarinimicrobiota bacterium]